ncbi:hypothetical protein ACQ3I4_04315 [Zafaria sp. Z1313]|uniref:hypothetical protein n=1 Tax=Zafaria sp. Z1313 TaxID=3423202 RepID=UPI003D303534
MRLRAVVAGSGPVPAEAGAAEPSPGLHVWGSDFLHWDGPRGYALDGASVLGDVAVTRPEEAAACLGGRASTTRRIAETWGERARNPSCLVVVDRDEGLALFLPDPLGGCLVWRLAAGPFDLVSSDLVSLVEVAAVLGHAPRKSVDFQLERMVLGNGGLTPASYDGVERAEMFGYWTLSSTGVVAGRYSSVVDAVDEEKGYGEALASVRQEVIDAVTAIARLPASHRVAHLTGGFDSRLVLGAILETGTQKDFQFFCSGPEGTHDRAVADGLTARFGLQRTDSAGLSPTPLGALHGRLTAPIFHSGGLTASGPVGGERPQGVVAVGGGYGEVLRSWYSVRWPEAPADPADPLELLARLTGATPEGGGLLTAGAYEGIGRRLAGHWKAASAAGHPRDFIGDALYSQIRNRYHIGQNSVLWSRTGARFDPLYSVAGFAAARQLPLEARSANVLGFDLMRGLAGDLAGYPFDKDRINEAYLRQRRAPRPRSFPEPARIGPVSRFVAEHGPVGDLPAGLDDLAVAAPALGPDARRELVERANTLGVNYWQLTSLDGAHASLRTALERLDAERYAGSLNLEYVRHLANYKARTRQEVRGVYSALTLIAWLGLD